MWNKLAETAQDPSVKRLAIAVVLSAILHTVLFGGFNFALPSLKKEMHVIDARIQLPKVVVKQVEAAEPEVKVAPDEKPAPKPEAQIEPEPIVEAPQDALPVDLPQPNIDEVNTAPNSIDTSDSQQTSTNQPQPPPQTLDTGLVINENAYQYVETEFDVRTEIDGKAQGKATITFNMVTNKQYQLRWLTQPSGVAALFIGDLLQTSEGEITKTGLQPTTYLYQYSKKADKARVANFDWQAKKVVSQTAKGAKTEDLPDGAQDLLSFMYQFMFVAPLQTMQIAINNGKRMRVYEYSFEGEENVNSAFGELKTIHIVHSGSSEEDKTELWLAIDYQYLPVKIRKTEDAGKVYELVATRINTNRPVLDNK